MSAETGRTHRTAGVHCLAALLLALAAGSGGCGRQPEPGPAPAAPAPLARVGTAVITLEDFAAEAGRRRASGRLPADAATLLQEMIERQAMLQKAGAGNGARSRGEEGIGESPALSLAGEEPAG